MKQPVALLDASAKIDQRIEELGDWRGAMLAKMRKLIHQAAPEIVEEWKWMGTPIFSQAGIVCTGETYKSVVKLTFAKGALLDDPGKLFNSSLEGNIRRAIDIKEGEKVNEPAFKALIRAAVALNVESKQKPKLKTKSRAPATAKRTPVAASKPKATRAASAKTASKSKSKSRTTATRATTGRGR